MNATLTPAADVAVRTSHRVRNAAAATLVTLAFVIGGASSASAQTVDPADPLDGAGDGFFTTLTGYLTGSLIPAVIGLTVIGVAVAMLIKWGKKGAKSA